MNESDGGREDPLDADKMNEIMDHLYAGQKIQAVKEYRDSRGVDLKTAKEFVEKLELELREKTPDRFSAKSGCAGILIAAMAGAYYLAEFLTTHLV